MNFYGMDNSWWRGICFYVGLVFVVGIAIGALVIKFI